MSEESRGHVFPKWGPRGPFRVYSWLQTTISGFGVVCSALMLVAGLVLPAAVLIVALGEIGRASCRERV